MIKKFEYQINGVKGTVTRVKVITSHSGYRSFLAHCGIQLGWIPRLPEIPSPYSSGPTRPVWHLFDSKPVVIVETAHKRYEVFAVNGPIAKTEEEIPLLRLPLS